MLVSLHHSAPKHPHTALRGNEVPLRTLGTGFSPSAERDNHFSHHRRLKGLSNFANASSDHSWYRYRQELQIRQRNRYYGRDELGF